MKRQANLRRQLPLVLGALLGGLTSLPLIGLSYLGERWANLPFIPFDLFEWLARTLPGGVVNVGLDSMVGIIAALNLGPIASVGKAVEQLLGVLIVIVGGAVVGLLVAVVIRQSNWPGRSVGAMTGFLAFLFVAAFEINYGRSVSGNPVGSLLWLALLLVGWGTLLGVWLSARELSGLPAARTAEFDAARRAFLVKVVGGSIGVTLAAWGVGSLLGTRQQTAGAGQPLFPQGSATPALGEVAPIALPPSVIATATAEAAVREQVPPAPGTRPDVTPNKDFYRVDIDLIPPAINEASWALQTSGLFDHPRPLTMTDLRAYPAVTQPIALCCISNPIGGDLISTAYVTGVRLGVVLQDLGLRPEAQALSLQAADGFFETVVKEDMMDPRTLLVYGMNGVALPQAHGFPLRIYIPNHYGMKQPKWITHMEAIDHQESGYWEDRGWSQQAIPRIVSIIDTVAKDSIENGQVPVGGIAWAGDRGIQKVEVQVDGGEWVQAVLRTPPVGPLTWVQWRYDWPARSGTHTFRVRATDGTGAQQIGESQDSFPDGATGYDSVTVTI
jgi:DMSO/TMAO reductase YedYZ molybdopterin-dependent catalytic subunit